MYKIKSLLHLSLAILLVGIISLSLSAQVSALEITPEKFQLDMTINADKSAEGTIQLEIKNTYTNKFLTEYEFRLPIKNVSRIISQVNGTGVNFESTTLPSNYPTVKIRLTESQILRENQSGTISIFFSSKNAMQQRGSLSELYIPNPTQMTAGMPNFGMRVVAHNLVGNVLYVDKDNMSHQESAGDKSFLLNSPSDLLVIFGNESKFGLRTQFQIVNDRADQKKTLFNLFGNFYDVEYQKLNYGNYGVSNQFGNNFAVVQIPQNEKIEVDIVASIDLKSTRKNEPPPKYNLYLDYDSDFFQSINQVVNDTEMSFEGKYKYINEEIKQNSRSNKQLSIKWESGPDIWYKFTTGTTSLNAFELCYLIGSMAEFFGDEFRMYYGYLLFPSFSSFDISLPHLWCEVEQGGNKILVDTFLENLTGSNYYNKKVADRITIGVAHPDFAYDPILGLREESYSPIRISFLEFFESTNEMSPITATLNTPSKVLSGEFFEGTLQVKNERNNFLPFTDILINGRSEIGNIFVHRDLNFGLLPFRKNNFQLNFLRELNIFFDGERELNVELVSDNETVVMASQIIRFEINYRLLYLALSVTIGLVLIVGLALRYYIKKKQVQ